MNVIDKLIMRAVGNALRDGREKNPQSLITRVKQEIQKPFPEFNLYETTYSIQVELGKNEKVTIEKLQELQNQHGIPTNSNIRTYSRDSYNQDECFTIIFEWENSNNIKEDK